MENRAFPAPAALDRPLRALLLVLFCGPLLAPLLQATRLPLLADTGALARGLLASYVCPTPDRAYALLGFPMAVCARCWGATIGLWAAYAVCWWLPDGGGLSRLRARYLGLAWPLRLALAALPFGLWALEIARWPTAPLPLLLLNGAHAGFWAGLFLCGALARSAARRA